MKREHTEKIILPVIILCTMLILFYGYRANMTGFSAADVSVNEKTQGAILLGYNQNVNLTTTQNITAEFVNTGTVNYSARIELTIYMYNNTTGNLEQMAAYFDSYAFLNPGDRRSFSTIFLPYKTGVYYIKARVPYDSKVAEMWGSFFVTWNYNIVPEIKNIVTSYGGGTIPAQRETGVTGLELEYNDSIDVYPGQSLLVPVRMNNTGTINLHNLKFYSSITNNINFEVNPKEIYELLQKESSVFLISLDISNNTSPGVYDFFFQVLGVEVKRTGTIQINVSSIAIPIEDEVRDAILNYEYLITDLNHQIYLTHSKGFNTSKAEEYLFDAKKNLEDAKNYFKDGDYEEARNILEIVKRDLENVVMNLAAVAFRVYEYPAFSPYLILLLLIIILIALIIFYYLYRKREKGRPRILKEFAEEGES